MSYFIDPVEAAIVRFRLILFLKIRGSAGKPMARKSFCDLAMHSTSQDELVANGAIDDEFDLTERVLDTWISGDTSRGKRRFSVPSWPAYLLIKQFLLEQKYLFADELDAIVPVRLPLEHIAMLCNAPADDDGTPPLQSGRYFHVSKLEGCVDLTLIDLERVGPAGGFALLQSRIRFRGATPGGREKCINSISNYLSTGMISFDDKYCQAGFLFVQNKVNVGIIADALNDNFSKNDPTTLNKNVHIDIGKGTFSEISFDSYSKESIKGAKFREFAIYEKNSIMKNVENILFSPQFMRPHHKFTKEIELELNLDEKLLDACINVDPEMVKQYLNQGADINYSDPDTGVTPLIVAARRDARYILPILLEHPDINVLAKDKMRFWLASDYLAFDPMGLKPHDPLLDKLLEMEREQAAERGVDYESHRFEHADPEPLI